MAFNVLMQVSCKLCTSGASTVHLFLTEKL